MTVDEAVEADRRYFDVHPDENEYIRDFVPGEFGKAELPEIPDGFRFATHVSVKLRGDREPVGRYRRLMMVCDDLVNEPALGRVSDITAPRSART
jgi:hypothetical protein